MQSRFSTCDQEDELQLAGTETEIEREIERLIEAGALGRSRIYARLLRYLADTSSRGELPKELDIANDVLQKRTFDPAVDSSVRVYVHNLRQKLAAYYESHPGSASQRLTIPRGKYQVVLAQASSPTEPAAPEPQRRWPLIAALLLAATALAFVAGRWSNQNLHADNSPFAAAPVWQAILDDDLPVVIVVGDYFMFAEGSKQRPGHRLIRDFNLNSSADFEEWLRANPELRDSYVDIQLSYLPVGIAPALNNVLSVLDDGQRSIRVIPQSQFRAQLMRVSHVVYLGYLSGIGHLGQYTFAASRLSVGMSYDELLDLETGEEFVSSAGYVTDSGSDYLDYGLAVTFPGPAENQFLVIAGLRDEGLMRMAAIVADPKTAATLGATSLATPDQDSVAPAFEALYRVHGVDRTHIAATPVFSAPIDASRIWTNEP